MKQRYVESEMLRDGSRNQWWYTSSWLISVGTRRMYRGIWLPRWGSDLTQVRVRTLRKDVSQLQLPSERAGAVGGDLLDFLLDLDCRVDRELEVPH